MRPFASLAPDSASEVGADPAGKPISSGRTMRFGADPSQSVLDLNCKAHGIDNLYVTDASFFPSIGAVNPTLTIIANALRVGDHVITRLK